MFSLLAIESQTKEVEFLRIELKDTPKKTTLPNINYQNEGVEVIFSLAITGIRNSYHNKHL